MAPTKHNNQKLFRKGVFFLMTNISSKVAMESDEQVSTKVVRTKGVPPKNDYFSEFSDDLTHQLVSPVSTEATELSKSSSG